eukprot:4434881-Amphidinium_carterae.1
MFQNPPREVLALGDMWPTVRSRNVFPWRRWMMSTKNNLRTKSWPLSCAHEGGGFGKLYLSHLFVINIFALSASLLSESSGILVNQVLHFLIHTIQDFVSQRPCGLQGKCSVHDVHGVFHGHLDEHGNVHDVHAGGVRT